MKKKILFFFAFISIVTSFSSVALAMDSPEKKTKLTTKKLDQIPNEVINEIFLFLKLSDILSSRLVSKAFNSHWQYHRSFGNAKQKIDFIYAPRAIYYNDVTSEKSCLSISSWLFTEERNIRIYPYKKYFLEIEAQEADFTNKEYVVTSIKIKNGGNSFIVCVRLQNIKNIQFEQFKNIKKLVLSRLSRKKLSHSLDLPEETFNVSIKSLRYLIKQLEELSFYHGPDNECLDKDPYRVEPNNYVIGTECIDKITRFSELKKLVFYYTKFAMEGDESICDDLPGISMDFSRLKKLESLKIVNMGDCSNNTPTFFLKGLGKALKVLLISNFRTEAGCSNNDVNVADCIKGLKTLEDLTLYNVSFKKINFNELDNLKALTLGSLHDDCATSDWKFDFKMGCNKKLERLALLSFEIIEKWGLIGFKSLEELYLIDCEVLDLRDLLNKLPSNLKKLYMMCFWNFENKNSSMDNVFKDWKPKNKGLKVIKLFLPKRQNYSWNLSENGDGENNFKEIGGSVIREPACMTCGHNTYNSPFDNYNGTPNRCHRCKKCQECEVCKMRRKFVDMC